MAKKKDLKKSTVKPAKKTGAKPGRSKSQGTPMKRDKRKVTVNKAMKKSKYEFGKLEKVLFSSAVGIGAATLKGMLGHASNCGYSCGDAYGNSGYSDWHCVGNCMHNCQCTQ